MGVTHAQESCYQKFVQVSGVKNLMHVHANLHNEHGQPAKNTDDPSSLPTLVTCMQVFCATESCILFCANLYMKNLCKFLVQNSWACVTPLTLG